jgi:hypothetical protein
MAVVCRVFDRRSQRPTKLTTQQRETIMDLASDFRALWKSTVTSGKDRQDLVRILIERIVVEVIDETERLGVTIHWSGGFTSQHETRRTVMTFRRARQRRRVILACTGTLQLRLPTRGADSEA